MGEGICFFFRRGKLEVKQHDSPELRNRGHRTEGPRTAGPVPPGLSLGGEHALALTHTRVRHTLHTHARTHVHRCV